MNPMHEAPARFRDAPGTRVYRLNGGGAVLVSLVFVLVISRVDAQIIVNGSFEDGFTVSDDTYTAPAGSLSTTALTGWTLSATPTGGVDPLAGVGINSGISMGMSNIPDGHQAVFLQGRGSVSQQITFAAGSYTVSFYAESRNSGLGDNPLAVTIDATTLTFGGATSVLPAFSTSFNVVTSDSFNIAAGVHTLTLAGTIPFVSVSSDHTSFVDKVSVTAVPEPTTWSAAAGVAALIFVACRRKHSVAG